MNKPTLRKGDGFLSGRPEVKEHVRELQRLLGISPADGLFGEGTEDEVAKYQAANGLGADGIVGKQTWKSLLKVHKADAPQLGADFRGDLSWIHAREGHAGKAYWPGGASGVTLDPGFDLGHVKPSLFEEAYSGVLSAAEMEACREVIGIKGDAAKKALSGAGDVLKSIRISREQADSVFPFVATPYWKGITDRFPSLLIAKCPASVQTALLSIAFNRGYGNRHLSVLDPPLSERDWKKTAVVIGEMQQDHKLPGIIKRRRMESNLIRKELGMSLLDTKV